MSTLDAKTTNENQLAAIASYLKTRRILIVDPSKSCRASIIKALTDMGANMSNIFAARSYQEAEQLIDVKHIQFVISDYLISRQCSLLLLQKLAVINPNLEDRLFILVTGNSQESTVAEAAEEDVDAFICKPFTSGTLIEYLIEAVSRKIEPTKYHSLLNQGRRKIEKKEFEDAIPFFSEAKAIDPKPSLACYYLGVTNETFQKLEQAKLEYNEGLQHRELHYKCLIGKFELLNKTGQEKEAFQTVEIIAKHFPISPQRLGRVFQLAVYTYHFEEMDAYYELFLSLPHRTEKLMKTVAASLVVAGKHLLRQQDKARAMTAFRNASTAYPNGSGILREIIFSLARHEMLLDADEFFQKFPEEFRTSEDYRILKFLVMSGGNATLSIVSEGRKLLAEGIIHPEIFRIMIRRYCEFDKPEAAEDLVHKACTHFPELKEEFLELLQ